MFELVTSNHTPFIQMIFSVFFFLLFNFSLDSMRKVYVNRRNSHTFFQKFNIIICNDHSVHNLSTFSLQILIQLSVIECASIIFIWAPTKFHHFGNSNSRKMCWSFFHLITFLIENLSNLHEQNATHTQSMSTSALQKL